MRKNAFIAPLFLKSLAWKLKVRNPIIIIIMQMSLHSFYGKGIHLPANDANCKGERETKATAQQEFTVLMNSPY